MQQIMIKLALKLLTEQFLAKAIVLGCRQLSKSTANDLDDKMTEALSEALGVK